MEKKYNATLDGEGHQSRDKVWTVGYFSSELKEKNYPNLLKDAQDFFYEHGKTINEIEKLN